MLNFIFGILLGSFFTVILLPLFMVNRNENRIETKQSDLCAECLFDETCKEKGVYTCRGFKRRVGDPGDR